MGERVPVDQFLEELERDFDEASSSVGAGHPACYEIEWALNAQRKEYVMGIFRRLLKHRKFVVLGDAINPHDHDPKNPRIWRRDDWEEVNADRDEWDES